MNFETYFSFALWNTLFCKRLRSKPFFSPDEERRPYDDSQPYEDHGLDDHSLEDQVHTHVVRYKGQQGQ